MLCTLCGIRGKQEKAEMLSESGTSASRSGPLKEEVPGPGDSEPPLQERKPGGGCRLVALEESWDAHKHPQPACTPRVDSESRNSSLPHQSVTTKTRNIEEMVQLK